MLNSKENVIINCINSIDIINSIDCNPSDAKEALKKALDHILNYPGISQLKRSVLKTAITPDRNAVKIERLLRLCLNDSTSAIERESALPEIKLALFESLEYLELI